MKSRCDERGGEAADLIHHNETKLNRVQVDLIQDRHTDFLFWTDPSLLFLSRLCKRIKVQILTREAGGRNKPDSPSITPSSLFYSLFLPPSIL